MKRLEKASYVLVVSVTFVGCFFDRTGVPIDNPLPLCGNGTLDATEICDSSFEGCLDNCSACTDGLEPNGVGGCLDPALCGDGVLDPGEDCDDEGESEDCNSNCTFSECGDGIVNLTAGEVCDSSDNCLESCTCPPNMAPNGAGGCLDPALCGDGNIDPGEDCDDSGESEGCNSDCTFASCGDGVLNETAGEFCDDAGNTASCDSDCSLPECGDGHHNPAAGEACDTGGESASCNDDCTLPECGDGNVNQAAGEQCDDSGESADCNANCSIAACGDGIVNATAGEVCDDSNTDSGDGCSADCRSDESCGNGVTDVAVGEVCDDGNNTPGDGCSADCHSDESCGNGIYDAAAGEVCEGGPGCLLSCLCPEGMGPDGSGGCQVDASTCHDGIDNDGDGDTDCDDTKCGVIHIDLNQGGNIYLETAARSEVYGLSPGQNHDIDIDSADAWARIYVYARITDASNDHGFLYWQPGVPHPAPFSTSGTPATVHSYDYGSPEWTNYSLTCQ